MPVSIHRFEIDNGATVLAPILSNSIYYDEEYALIGGNVKDVNLNDATSWISSPLPTSSPTIKYCISFFKPISVGVEHAFSNSKSQKYSWFMQNINSTISQIETCHGKRDCVTFTNFPEFRLVKDHSDVLLKIWTKLKNQSKKDMKDMNADFLAIRHDHWALIPIQKMSLLDFKTKLDDFIRTSTKCNFFLKGASDFNFLPDYKDWEDNSLRSVLKFASTVENMHPMLLLKTSAVFTAFETNSFEVVMAGPYFALAFFRFLRCLVRNPDCKINQKIQKYLDYIHEKYGFEIDDDISCDDGIM